MTSNRLPPNSAPQPTDLPCIHGPPLPIPDAPAATRRAVHYACSRSEGTHAYNRLSQEKGDGSQHEQGGKDVMPPAVLTRMERLYLFLLVLLLRPPLKLEVWR